MGALKGVETKPGDWGGLCAASVSYGPPSFPARWWTWRRASGAGLERKVRCRTGWQRPVEPQGRGFFSGKGRAKVWKWPWGLRRTPPLLDLGSSGSGELSDPHEGPQGSSQTGVCPRRGGREAIDHTLSPQGLDCLGAVHLCSKVI